MLWNSSNTLGCAWNVRCANMTGFPSMTFFVCEYSDSWYAPMPRLTTGNYWPQGNIGTQPPGTLYAENVPRWAKWTDEQVPDVPFTAPPGGGSFTSPTRTPTVGGMGSPRGAAATGATSAAANVSLKPRCRIRQFTPAFFGSRADGRRRAYCPACWRVARWCRRRARTLIPPAPPPSCLMRGA